MALIWDTFLEDYEDEIENRNWDLRDILKIFWHYSQDGKKAVEKMFKEPSLNVSGDPCCVRPKHCPLCE